MTITPEDALERLRRGNARFVAGEQQRSVDSAERAALAAGQEPFAVVLGCSDSRVPIEVVFDQGLGDLFVIRVAGNIATPSLIGSIEFAAQNFGTQLVVVLGHTQCGAVDATLRSLRSPGDPGSRNLGAIVEKIQPAVAPLLEQDEVLNPAELMHEAVRRNVTSSIGFIRNESPVIESLIDDGRLRIVGAEYSLETGVVDFFAGVPD